MPFDATLPSTSLVRDALAFARDGVTEPVLNHSVRSFLFARAIADRPEHAASHASLDPELLFVACVLHDLGTADLAPGAERFEIEGADLAAAFLRERGADDDAAELVWEAIALHSSPGIAERRRPFVALVRRGVVADFGQATQGIDDETAARIHEAYPRLELESNLVDEIVRHAERGGPAAAPRFGLGGELVRERREQGVTVIERAAASSRWAQAGRG